MTPETMQDIKRAALAIFSIAERITLEGLESPRCGEAAQCIRLAASAILEALQEPEKRAENLEPLPGPH